MFNGLINDVTANGLTWLCVYIHRKILFLIHACSLCVHYVLLSYDWFVHYVRLVCTIRTNSFSNYNTTNLIIIMLAEF